MTEPAYQLELPLVMPTPAAGARSSTQKAAPAGEAVDDAEARMLAGLVAEYPSDALRWHGPGQPSVLARVVAAGTYGRISGVGERGSQVTAHGYVLQARPVRGGLGGWHDHTALVVHVGDLPDGPVTAIVQAELDARLDVLRPPRDGLPPGEVAPWLRLPVEHQILAARHALGLEVHVVDGPSGPLWTVEGCPHPTTGDVAQWLFGGRYGSWECRARPVFDQRHIDHAIATGRVQPDGQPWPDAAARDGDPPVTQPRPPWTINRTVPDVQARRREVVAGIAQALIYRTVAEATRTSAREDFTAPDGQVVRPEQLGTHLAAIAGHALGDAAPRPGGTWHGVQVSFQRADPSTAHLRLSTDGINHVRIEIPAAWIADAPDSITAALTDAFSYADRRAAALADAANALADYLGAVRDGSPARTAFPPPWSRAARQTPVLAGDLEPSQRPRPPHRGR